MAGVTGLDTMRMTLREIDLAWKARSDWDHRQTAEILAAVYNIRPRGKHDTRNFTASDFYRLSSERDKAATRQRSTKGTPLTIGLLRALKHTMFGDN